MAETAAAFRCGHVAVVGRPNVGKSTLVNCLVGERISITSKKAQTTRHRVTGILTTADAQFIFVDTPGFQTRHRARLNVRMNRVVTESLLGGSFVLEAGRTVPADRPVSTRSARIGGRRVEQVDALAMKGLLRRSPGLPRCGRSPRSCR